MRSAFTCSARSATPTGRVRPSSAAICSAVCVTGPTVTVAPGRTPVVVIVVGASVVWPFVAAFSLGHCAASGPLTSTGVPPRRRYSRCCASASCLSCHRRCDAWPGPSAAMFRSQPARGHLTREIEGGRRTNARGCTGSSTSRSSSSFSGWQRQSHHSFGCGHRSCGTALFGASRHLRSMQNELTDTLGRYPDRAPFSLGTRSADREWANSRPSHSRSSGANQCPDPVEQ